MLNIHEILDIFFVWNIYRATLKTNGVTVTITPNPYFLGRECNKRVDYDLMHDVAQSFVAGRNSDGFELKIVHVSSLSFTIR